MRVDLSGLHTAGAHVQHEDVLSLHTREEARGTAQDTSKYGCVLKDTLGEGRNGHTSKGDCLQRLSFVYQDDTTDSLQMGRVPSVVSSSDDGFVVLPPQAVALTRSKLPQKNLKQQA